MAWHKNLHKWLGSYFISIVKRRPKLDGNTHIIFSVVDHFEPFTQEAPFPVAHERVKRWVIDLPELTQDIRDSDGKPYRHTFFYPTEQYHPVILDDLSALCTAGLGEVEIHIHHDGATSLSFRQEMVEFKRILSDRHGLLSRSRSSDEIRYGFIHGNWALDNSRPDGKYCGVNDELIALKETGCYADFTFPSAPDITQVSKINSIYYASDDPERPCSHNTGKEVRVGSSPSGDLLLVQGPLTLDWTQRKRGFFPGIENGEIGGGRAPSLHRFMLWVGQGITVIGRDEWIFIKVHCHGALEKNAEMLLGYEMRHFLISITETARAGGFCIHFVTSREMYNIIRAAEDGEAGNPGLYRDYILVPNPCSNMQPRSIEKP